MSTTSATGATDAQIMAAAERRLESMSWLSPASKETHRYMYPAEARFHAEWLVTTDEAIVNRQTLALVLGYATAKAYESNDPILPMIKELAAVILKGFEK